MSSGFPGSPIGKSQRSAAVSPEPTMHESRASFRPAATPGRRAAAAGLDTLDLAENHEQTRRNGSRRRERRIAEQQYE
jgi:hypothetical protein